MALAAGSVVSLCKSFLGQMFSHPILLQMQDLRHHQIPTERQETNWDREW